MFMFNSNINDEQQSLNNGNECYNTDQKLNLDVFESDFSNILDQNFFLNFSLQEECTDINKISFEQEQDFPHFHSGFTIENEFEPLKSPKNDDFQQDSDIKNQYQNEQKMETLRKKPIKKSPKRQKGNEKRIRNQQEKGKKCDNNKEKQKSLEYIVFMCRLYHYYNNREDIQLFKNEQKIKELLMKQPFLSKVQVGNIMKNLANFQNNNLISFKLNTHQKVKREILSDIMELPAKTVLDYCTYLKKAFFYSKKTDGKNLIYQNFLGNEGISDLNISDLRSWVKSIEKNDKINASQLKELDIVPILNSIYI